MKVTYGQSSTVKRQGEGVEEEAHKSLKLNLINLMGNMTHWEVVVDKEPDTFTWNYDNTPGDELQQAIDAEMDSMNNCKAFTPVKKTEVKKFRF